MSDLQRYIDKRSQHDEAFALDFDSGYENFKIGVLLRQAREEAGLTQGQVAEKMKTTRSVISRMENHAEDVRLSTLRKYAKALGAEMQIQFVRPLAIAEDADENEYSVSEE